MSEYIKRPEAWQAVQDAFNRHLIDYKAGQEIMDSLAEIPAADVAPVKRGRWKYTPAYLGAEFVFYVCSSCGSPFWWNTSKYCPDCGAKMNGGADGE